MISRTTPGTGTPRVSNRCQVGGRDEVKVFATAVSAGMAFLHEAVSGDAASFVTERDDAQFSNPERTQKSSRIDRAALRSRVRSCATRGAGER